MPLPAAAVGDAVRARVLPGDGGTRVCVAEALREGGADGSGESDAPWDGSGDALGDALGEGESIMTAAGPLGDGDEDTDGELDGDSLSVQMQPASPDHTSARALEATGTHSCCRSPDPHGYASSVRVSRDWSTQ